MEILDRFSNQLPPLFSEFYERFEKGFLEYEFLEDSSDNLLAYIGNESFADEIILFLKDGIGSCFGFWLVDGGILSESPIVHLNSEGSPMAVYASGFKEFLSLLYYGSYSTYEQERYISRLERNEKLKDLGKIDNRPFKQFSVEELEENQEEIREEFEEDYDDLITWLNDQGIKKPLNVFDIVKNNYDNFPKLAPIIRERTSY